MNKLDGHITEDQLKAYLKGDVSEEDRYKIDREQEKDPLLKEAMQGLEDLTTTELDESLDRLKLKRADRNGLPLLQIAGIVMLLLVAGVSVWYVSQPLHPEPLSMKKESVPEVAPRMLEPLVELRENEAEESEVLIDTEIAEPSIVVEEYDMESSEAVEQIFEPMAEEIIIPDQVDNLPVAVSKDEDLGSSDGLLAPEKKAESEMTRSTSRPGANYSNSFARSARSTSTAESSFDANPTPLEGSQAYQKYLSDSLRYHPEMGEGFVTVKFFVDSLGQPKDISVINSLNEYADQEAIRLVVEGPHWTGAIGISVNLAIPIGSKQ